MTIITGACSLPIKLKLSSGASLSDFIDLESLPKRRHFSNHPFIDRLRLAVPFDYIAVSGLDVDNFRFGSGHSVDTDVPPAFLDSYYGDDVMKTDPFVILSKLATTVVIEDDVYRETPPSPRLRYLAKSFNIHNRTLFPLLRGELVYGAVTFSRSTPFQWEEINFLSGVAVATHQILTKPIMDKFSAQELKLSKGEIICLRLGSLGKTSEEIAHESDYAIDTVNTYIKAATKKLNAKNRSHAIAEAIRRDLIK